MTKQRDFYLSELGEWWAGQLERVNLIIEHDDNPSKVRVATKQRVALLAFEKEQAGKPPVWTPHG